jgi:hypothetical protein
MSSLAPTSRNMDGDDSSHSSGETCSSSSSGSSCSIQSRVDPPTHIVTAVSSSTATSTTTDLVDLSQEEEVIVDGGIITELHVNDVLHGRGAAYDRMEGNLRFRALVKTRALAYRLGDSVEKKSIAQEIVSHVHNSGGRFLRVVDSISEAKELGVASPGEVVWVTVPPAVALEKVKQALRDSKRQEPSTPHSGGNGGSYMEMGGGLPSLLQRNEDRAPHGIDEPYGQHSSETLALEGLAGLSSVATSLSHCCGIKVCRRDGRSKPKQVSVRP